MFMPSVAGINDAGMDMPRQHHRRSRTIVTHHDDIDFERLNIFTRIDQGFTFADTGRLCGDVDDVSREPLGGDLKRDPRPRRRLIKQIDNSLAAEGRDLFDLASDNLLKRGSRRKDQFDLIAR